MRMATVFWYVRESPCTPTLFTGSRTAKYCQRSFARPVFLSLCGRYSLLPGPPLLFLDLLPLLFVSQRPAGEGLSVCYPIRQAEFFPIALTSSLYRSASGSIIFRLYFSGRPPTLWWLLMVAALCMPDSILSGYIVPWTRNPDFIFPASSSKMRMKSSPIIFLFFSGSVTPLRAEKKRSLRL